MQGQSTESVLGMGKRVVVCEEGGRWRTSISASQRGQSHHAAEYECVHTFI